MDFASTSLTCTARYWLWKIWGPLYSRVEDQSEEVVRWTMKELSPRVDKMLHEPMENSFLQALQNLKCTLSFLDSIIKYCNALKACVHIQVITSSISRLHQFITMGDSKTENGWRRRGTMKRIFCCQIPTGAGLEVSKVSNVSSKIVLELMKLNIVLPLWCEKQSPSPESAQEKVVEEMTKGKNWRTGR